MGAISLPLISQASMVNRSRVYPGFRKLHPGYLLDGENRRFQAPDAENRMSGGVGGVTGAIPLLRPDLG